MKYYIKDDYYFDIDGLNQLRITGPENHLLLGIGFPSDIEISVEEYLKTKKDELKITLRLPVKELEIPIPLVSNIRTLRNLIEPVVPRPTYKDLVEAGKKEVMPKKIKTTVKKDMRIISFLKSYTDDQGKKKIYGADIIVPSNNKIDIRQKSIKINADEPIKLIIKTITNIKLEGRIGTPIFLEYHDLPKEILSPFLISLYQELKNHIEHLIKTKKTSSFEYGTIFPRDWVESADLGDKDLSPETVDYMYEQSMSYISEIGEGWHEDAVGEYKANLVDKQIHIDRKMIDIEPRYILGMREVSKNFLTKEENIKKLRLVAQFILNNAREREFITFKKRAESENEYFPVGNWRDSYYAFPRQKSPLAPYDVNCVFYPESLKLIREYKDFFAIEDEEELDKLIDKWTSHKQKFRLYHPGNIIGYSLALHGKKHTPLPTPHLDESYDHFYGSPSWEEIASFAEKVVDPDYFYTPVGPLLVETDSEEFTTKQYHGKVVWPKQAAYVVAGLSKQFRKGLDGAWPYPIMNKIRRAIIKTCEACFNGWQDLQAVPELYYYDEKEGRARFYTDQEDYEGQMSLIQLWSAVGARRIIREYVWIIKE
jgi:hypothetical protein